MPITLQQLLFFVFSGLVLVSALMVIMQNNPVRAVLFLVVSFLASAVLWLMANAEFLALILVLVYVGAVMTLFLFVVMMLNVDQEVRSAKKLRYFPVIVLISGFLTALVFKILPWKNFGVEVAQAALEAQPAVSNTEALGLVLYTDYLLPFELAAVLLLVAIVSAITLAHRGPIRSKRQHLRRQLMTRREDHISIQTMKVEK
jgi:NADH-quinone oxidoreductase subunit J